MIKSIIFLCIRIRYLLPIKVVLLRPRYNYVNAIDLSRNDVKSSAEN